MFVQKASFEKVVNEDIDVDVEPIPFEELDQFFDGKYTFVSVRARIIIDIPAGEDSVGNRIIATKLPILSPGTCGLRSDRQDQIDAAFEHEKDVLAHILIALGTWVSDIKPNVAQFFTDDNNPLDNKNMLKEIDNDWDTLSDEQGSK